MRKFEIDILASPKTLLPLNLYNNVLKDSENNTYVIWKDIPLLLPDNNCPDWHRELMEAILWDYPEELNKMYEKISFKSDPNIEYKQTIRELLKDKGGIEASLEKYAVNSTDSWIAIQGINNTKLEENYKKYSSYFNGKKRVKTKKRPKNTFIYKSYKEFSLLCLKNNPKTIIELATGAGGGTAALALHMNRKTRLYTVDIGPDCLANAFGIAKYTHKKNIFPICANFWYLPFKSECADTVCTFCGLDESREINITLSEIKRILKQNGSFICVSRKSSFMRQASILEEFGFEQNKCDELMKKCRLYSSFNDLKHQCERIGLESIYSKEIIKDEKTIFVISEFKKKSNLKF